MQIQPNSAQFVSQSGSRGFPSPLPFRQTYSASIPNSSTEDLSRQNSSKNFYWNLYNFCTVPEEHHPPQSPVAGMTHVFGATSLFTPAQTSFAQQYR